MNVSHGQDLKGEEEVVQVLRAVRANDASDPPARHSKRTDQCIPVSRLAVVARLGGKLSDAEQRHHDGCAFCQRTLQTLRDSAGPGAGDETVTGEDTTHIGTKPRRTEPEPPGELPNIAGYQITRELGQGGMGAVYEARDTRLDRMVAIKVMKPAEPMRKAHERFLREVRVLAAIEHPNVVPVYEAGTSGDGLYIVMPLLAGSSLAAQLENAPTPMPPRNAVEIARELALGLSAAHAKGMVHRDLKPANVLLTSAGDTVRVADFGLVRRLPAPVAETSEPSHATPEQPSDAVALLPSPAPVGTPAYMAPEQLQEKAGEVGPSADLYSLGVTLYEMLAGRVPFSGSEREVMQAHREEPPVPPSAVRPDLDTRLDAICLKAMEKRPADRYRSAKDFAAALTDYLNAPDRS